MDENDDTKFTRLRNTVKEVLIVARELVAVAPRRKSLHEHQERSKMMTRIDKVTTRSDDTNGHDATSSEAAKTTDLEEIEAAINMSLNSSDRREKSSVSCGQLNEQFFCKYRCVVNTFHLYSHFVNTFIVQSHVIIINYYFYLESWSTFFRVYITCFVLLSHCDCMLISQSVMSCIFYFCVVALQVLLHYLVVQYCVFLSRCV